MRVSPIVNSFSSGELTPRLMGRTDSPKYASGCQTLENFVALPHGGARRRGGTRYINEVKDSANTARLISFEYSVSQTYVLELGDQYMRFYTTGTSDFGQVQSGGTAYEIATPWLHSEVNEIQFAQNADVMWLVHPNHAPQKLVRSAHTNWALTTESFKKGPFNEVNQNEAVTIAFSDTSSTTQNITASSALFDSGHVGTDWLIDTLPGQATGEVVWVRVNSVASSTVANVTIKDTQYMPQSTNVSSLWQPPAFCSAHGFPSSVVFYEQRLWYAATDAKPQSFWGSKPAQYESFAPGSNDDDGLFYTIASDRVNRIKWLAAQRVLIAGTTGGEFRITGGDTAITPTNIDVSRQTPYGSKDARPIYVGNEVFFIQRSGTQIRNVAYKWESDAFDSDDITFLAEHITEGGVTRMAYTQVPDSLLYALRADGTLLMLTYEPSQEVVGWHRHLTNGKFLDIAIISEDGPDQVVFVVERTINGTTKRFIELYEPNDFIDCFATYSGTATAQIGGLSHLEGKEVQIIADEGVHPSQTVSGGQVTLNYTASEVAVGLGYTSILKPNRYGAAVGDGTSMGKVKRWNQVFVRLEESAIPYINGERPSVRDVNTNYGEPQPMISEDVEIRNLGYDRDGDIEIKQDLPLPCHIVALYGTLGIGG